MCGIEQRLDGLEFLPEVQAVEQYHHIQVPFSHFQLDMVSMERRLT